MPARIIDGKQIAKAVREEVGVQAKAFAAQQGRSPGLAAVLVGDDPASHVYVRSKRKACAEAGLESWQPAACRWKPAAGNRQLELKLAAVNRRSARVRRRRGPRWRQ